MDVNGTANTDYKQSKFVPMKIMFLLITLSKESCFVFNRIVNVLKLNLENKKDNYLPQFTNWW